MPSSISRAPQQLLGQGGHVVGEALSDGGHFLQALALGGGSTGNLIGGDAAYQAAAVMFLPISLRPPRGMIFNFSAIDR